MTWNELLEATRKEMGESATHVRALERMIATVSEGNGNLSKDQVGIMVVLLTLAISTLHSAVENISIGLDAVVETMRQASEAQEVKDE